MSLKWQDVDRKRAIRHTILDFTGIMINVGSYNLIVVEFVVRYFTTLTVAILNSIEW
jgi:hypothetical protein